MRSARLLGKYVTVRALPSSKAELRASTNYKWYALAAVMLGSFMSPLDASIANVALPTIGHAFGTPIDAVEWVLIAYMLTTSATLVLFGRLGDLIGQKRVYAIGFAIFGASSLACAFAPAFAALVAARAVQGLGSAMLMSSSPAIITDSFPARQRGRAIGLNGAAVAVGLSTGPVLGGFIVTYWDWRWIFLINVPISIVAMIVASFVLRREERQAESFDFWGAAIAFTTLLALSLALPRAHAWGWGSWITISLLAYTAIGLWVFLVVERRVTAPMMALELFANRTFAFSVLAATLYFCAMYSVIFTVPLVAQTALGKNGLQAGLLLLPISALNIVLAPLAGALSDRFPARYISTIGAAVFFIGSLLLALQPVHPELVWLYVSLVVTGAGTAVFTQPNNSTIMGHAPANRRGIAAGILATARTSGQLLGVCLAGAIFFLRSQQAGAYAHTYSPAKDVFYAVAAIALLVAFVSFNRD
jgi:EmrB/QacA subfamily drug resistance transporter